MSAKAPRKTGKVTLVGAGPGDPGLLTLRGRECLAEADVVIYDYLANPELLEHCRDSAEQICLGRHGSGRLLSQQQINHIIVEHGLRGRNVVRLKGGDPAVFARTHEELIAIEKAELPFEIVPGITAAMAVTSSVGIPLTHRETASAVALVTGQGKDGGPPQNLDYRALARFPGTLVFYMGTTTCDHWTSELIKAGLSAETNVVVVRHCSLPTQFSFASTLGQVADKIQAGKKMRPPVVFVVGATAAEFGKHNWFEKRPLFGKSVLVTRPQAQAAALGKRLASWGAEVLYQPAIKISPTTDTPEVQAALDRLREFDWIVFSSANGVECFLNRVCQTDDLRRIGQARLACIGPATAQRLSEYHLRADLVPESYEADALAEKLLPAAKGQRVLLIRASRGREVLAETLRPVAAEVCSLVCYESSDVTESHPDVKAQVAGGSVDYVTVTSSAIARSLVNLLGSSLSQTRLVSISPITSATLRELGHEPACEATEYTMDGVIHAILSDARRDPVEKSDG